MEVVRDAIIIGAGPAGLALATSLANLGLQVTVVEKLGAQTLAEPVPDGRDIALTHRSLAILKSLGIWQHLPIDEVAPIRSARVEQGKSTQFLQFAPRVGAGNNTLGYLVSNHWIRRAAYLAATASIAGRPPVELITGVDVAGLRSHGAHGEVTLADGRVLEARLMVAADSRFSENRRRMGIAAHMHDFGRAVIVCRMSHELPNEGIAHECFQSGHTLAVLPLNGKQCSVVVTLPSRDAEQLMEMALSTFAGLVEGYFDHRLGKMQLLGERHKYPLVAVYARQFVAPRFALLGDAAVGMHPVTAHGFNFGLYGVEALTQSIAAARTAGDDIGASAVLLRYQRIHRRATLPIFLGTNALVKLYTDDRPLAGMVRRELLRAADKLAPLKSWITRQLTDSPGTRRPSAAGRALAALRGLR
ncbi:MAG: 5-demethoxyubiquinol-8 5-hydroxylase UbiM [Betaproteobacteria bacterium]|nr:5-demethoxyubiquinol-8 5-hydroxylase UbiM [Betaproteobacteria bacterium]